MNNLIGIYTIWWRDIIRFWRDKPRIIGAVAQPALFLFVFGVGLSKGLGGAMGSGGTVIGGKFDYVTFIFPGIIGMTVLFTSIFSAISIIWDREFGFLKEVMVAPLSRWAVTIGKALGGSTVAMFQGTLILLFAPLLKVSLTPLKFTQMMGLMFITSFALTSLGIVIAARMKSMEGFQMIMNFFLMPMFFLSGAMFPLQNLPGWMKVLVEINPLSYSVDIMRYTVIGVNTYPIWRDLAVIVGFGVVMVGLAVFEFGRTE
ncbi:MAG: ABC transporter permease [Actinomycetota bacterium]